MGNSVYMIVNNQTGEKYVGFTTQKVKSRIQQHFTALRYNKHYNDKLQTAFNLHGEPVFAWEIIEEDVPLDKAFEKESFWINHYDSVDSGYNISNSVSKPNKDEIIDMVQIYIPCESHKKLIALAHSKGLTVSELIKRLIDKEGEESHV